MEADIPAITNTESPTAEDEVAVACDRDGLPGISPCANAERRTALLRLVGHRSSVLGAAAVVVGSAYNVEGKLYGVRSLDFFFPERRRGLRTSLVGELPSDGSASQATSFSHAPTCPLGACRRAWPC